MTTRDAIALDPTRQQAMIRRRRQQPEQVLSIREPDPVSRGGFMTIQLGQIAPILSKTARTDGSDSTIRLAGERAVLFS